MPESMSQALPGTLNPPPLDPRFLTAEDVQREMRAQGLSTAALFNPPAAPPVQVLDPQKLSDEAATETAPAAPAEPAAAPAPAAAPGGPTFFEESAPEAPATPQDSAPQEDDNELSEASLENFKKLRTVYKETKKSLKELEAQKREVEEKLKNYVPQETLLEKEARIAELARYEKIHNLKASREYRERFVEPINQAQTKLKEILKDYGVPEEHLDQAVSKAVSITNHAELNSFLADHFSDHLGAQEAKGLISNIRQIQADARAAESEPERTLENLHERMQAEAEAREAQRREQITKTARSAWEETMLEIQKEGQVKELIPVEDDPEFNENYAYKLIKQAASEYGKVITEMAKDGATPSKAVAKALAKMTALSQVAGVSIVTRNRAMQNAEEIARNAERTSGLYRPNVGGGIPARAPADQGAQRPVAPEDQLKSDVRGLLNQVLSKR